ncbi:tetratricopeptide repeat protein [Pseudomonas sp. BBP2017]|uniref:tetratricopeptide repeat protein n=1 Tax=Pseudomonas sp. BBP2017 TaxID=2109731 RepID=UPI000D13CB72|nr:SEL1-like repeat protein [Pseudomonas sp. BBP2017]PSS57703.1 hypothetical protein C6382_07350 [Pseudomonas sp. BBP2017]
MKLSKVVFMFAICAAIYWLTGYFSESTRINELKAEANAGDSSSQLVLGEYYMNERNYNEAIVWLSRAADQKNDKAINHLGLLAYLLGGNASSKEEKELALLLEKSLDKYRALRSVLDIYQEDLKKGNLNRLYEIGEMYYFGSGAPKDRAIAKEHFERSSAENSNNAAKSEYRLGEIYLYGYSVSANKQTALKWFEKSCRRPNLQACEEMDSIR